MFSVLLFAIISLCSASWNEKIQITPYERHFAASIAGVDLEMISDDDFDAVHLALLSHKVIVVRNQTNLTVEGQRRFTQRFGNLHVHLESSSHLPGFQDVNVVSNIKNENGNYIGLFGKHVENFHSDLSWTPLPTKITVLKSVIRPLECGDTIFADTNAAFDGLSDEFKAELAGLTCNFCYLKLREIDSDGNAQNLAQSEVESATRCAIHPLITTHPITGRRNVYANPSHTSSVVGFDPETSEHLLQRVFSHTAQEIFSYRHHYEEGDVIIWDNRAVHHRATDCPEAYPRKLVRTTVSNDEVPREHIKVPRPFDLSRDRVNAALPTRTFNFASSDL